MKKLIKKALGVMGYEIIKKTCIDLKSLFFYADLLKQRKIVDIDKLATLAENVPGMINSLNGRFLFILNYFQEIKGDVVEIGSWQGRSTSFLARATNESNNGNFYAIDHFKGNVGKEKFYVMGKEDLSNLESGFWNNME